MERGATEPCTDVHTTEYKFLVNIMLPFTVVLLVVLFSFENIVGQAVMVRGLILPMCSVRCECLFIFTESQH